MPHLPQGDWWVDDKGDLNNSSEIETSLDALFFRHLGQVKICVRPEEMAIHWDTSHVLGDSLPSVLERLFGCKKNMKVRLYFFYFGWVCENYDNPSAAICRIVQIQQCQFVDVLHPTLMNTCDIEDVEHSSPLIKSAFAIWERTSGQFNNLDQEEISGYLPHILIYRPDQKEDNIIYSWVGRNSVVAKYYGNEWVRDSIGQISNKTFGVESQFHADKVSIGIVRTMITGEPLLHHFRVLWEENSQEPYWVSYERLLTRHTLHDGRPGVVSTVCETQKVRVPLAGST